MTYAESFYDCNLDKVFDLSCDSNNKIDQQKFDSEMDKLKDERLNELWKENELLTNGCDLLRNVFHEDKETIKGLKIANKNLRDSRDLLIGDVNLLRKTIKKNERYIDEFIDEVEEIVNID